MLLKNLKIYRTKNILLLYIAVTSAGFNILLTKSVGQLMKNLLYAFLIYRNRCPLSSVSQPLPLCFINLIDLIMLINMRSAPKPST